MARLRRFGTIGMGIVLGCATLVLAGRPAAATCDIPMVGTPTSTVYLPNVTKTLGGPTGWQTPFIIQNTGTAATTIEVSFFRFSDGECITRRGATLAPGTSFADVPNNDADLPGDTQFSVVVRSFGATIVGVVNEHAGVGARAEALAYDGFNAGSTKVSLPNVTRRFFGFVTPIIIQNLGSDTTAASASFVSFDGTSTLTVNRTIAPGRSQFIDPNSEPGLIDGKQYAVTITSAQPIAVVENAHNDAPAVANPVAYATDGISAGAAAVYAPYAAKNANGIGRLSTIVVQNVGTVATAPTLTFTPIAGSLGSVQTFASPSAIQPGASWAFDPRFDLGTTTPCAGPTATCLGDGEYSVVAASSTSVIAAVVNVISPATAMGYTASPKPDAKYFLPNVTRTLGGPSGWTTPILLQTVSAGGATLRWYRFSDGSLVTTQVLTVAAGTGIRIDPRDVAALSDDTQYAVVVDGTGGTVASIVIELATGGDNAMIYEGFPASGQPALTSSATSAGR